MKTRVFQGIIIALCVVLTSCYPYPEKPQREQANQATQRQTAEQQSKLKEQEVSKKKQVDQKKTERPQESSKPTATNTTSAPPTNTTPAPEPKRNEYPFANKVPGKDGFVFSPYNNKVVDVRDIPSGTLVQDPTYPASEKKYFRVP